MSTEWESVAAGVHAAQRTKSAIRAFTREMASLIADGLRKGDVDADVLRDLKRELREFDMVSGKWKA